MQIYSGTLDLILIIRDLRMMAMCCGEVRGSNLRRVLDWAKRIYVRVVA
jgi:hypothetical protein